jgi:hypothetical protein
VKKRFALIIGALGSGTTSLFRHLGAHPQVIPCRVKEPKFFTDDRKWTLGVDWYRSLWDFQEPDERIAIEASSSYSMHPAVPCPAQRIAQTPAGFRFIYLLRDPLARIAVHHSHAYAEGWTEEGLEEGVLRSHIDASRYAMQLDRYRQHFRREDFLLLRSEDFENDPLELMQRVCRFLEIDPYFEFPDLTASRGPLAGSWLGRLRGLSRWRRRRCSPQEEAEQAFCRLGPDQRAYALRELGEDLAKLEGEWGFDVSGWRLEP